MTVNVELLRTTLAHVEANPEEWKQSTWRCGTGMCFGGWACQLSGGEWAYPAHHVSNEFLVAEPDDDPRDIVSLPGADVVTAPARARRLLGLDYEQGERLFRGTNDLGRLTLIVSELCAEAEA